MSLDLWQEWASLRGCKNILQMRGFRKSIRCMLVGKVSVPHVTNPGNKTADVLSFCCLAPCGMAQGMAQKCLLKLLISTSCSQKRTVMPLCESRAAEFLQIRGKTENSASPCSSNSHGSIAANLTRSYCWKQFGIEHLHPRVCAEQKQ